MATRMRSHSWWQSQALSEHTGGHANWHPVSYTEQGDSRGPVTLPPPHLTGAEAPAKVIDTR